MHVRLEVFGIGIVKNEGFQSEHTGVKTLVIYEP